MAQTIGAGPVTNGLVYLIDYNNQRSYTGPAIQNLANALIANPVSGPSIEYTVGSQYVNIPNLGPMTVPFVNGYNSNPTNYCCISSYSYFPGSPRVACSGSTQYTYAIVYKNTSGYTDANFMYRYEYNSAGTQLAEAGIFNTTNRIALGDGWFWAWGTFTTNAATATMSLYGFQYNYNVSDIWYTAKVMVAPGNYTALNPVYWPDLGTTKSSTQVFRDPLGTNTFTASNLTYASDGLFGFNGSNSIITSPNNTALDTQTPTVEVWVKTNSLNQNGFFFEKGSVNTQYSLFQEGTNLVWRQRLNDSGGTLASLYAPSATYMNTSNWFQVVGTYTSGTRRIYVNGVQVASDTQTGTLATNSSGMSVGAFGGNSGSNAYFYNGNIGVVRVYDRALSATEVMQNFNSTRGRYGV
jgi:hypothetical protein